MKDKKLIAAILAITTYIEMEQQLQPVSTESKPKSPASQLPQGNKVN